MRAVLHEHHSRLLPRLHPAPRQAGRRPLRPCSLPLQKCRLRPFQRTPHQKRQEHGGEPTRGVLLVDEAEDVERGVASGAQPYDEDFAALQMHIPPQDESNADARRGAEEMALRRGALAPLEPVDSHCGDGARPNAREEGSSRLQVGSDEDD